MACKTSEAADEGRAQLLKAVQSLVSLNCDTSLFTPFAVNRLGLTVKNFIVRTNVLLSISDPTMLEEIVHAAIRVGVCDCFTPCGLSLADVFNISKWMRSTEGVCYVRRICKKQKIEKKSVNEDVLVQVLSKQFQEYKTTMKETKSRYDEEINRLRLEMQRLVREKASELKQLKVSFFPSCYIKEPTTDVLGKESYDMYVKEAVKGGKAPMPLSDRAIEMAIEMYGAGVRKQKMVEFIRKNQVAANVLQDYLEKRIVKLAEAGELRQIQKLRSDLAAIGGETHAADAAIKAAVRRVFNKHQSTAETAVAQQ